MEKFKKALKATLGDRINDMFYLGSLATNPTKQGRGYASALVKLSTDRVSLDIKAYSNITYTQHVNMLSTRRTLKVVQSGYCRVIWPMKDFIITWDFVPRPRLFWEMIRRGTSLQLWPLWCVWIHAMRDDAADVL